MNLYNYKKTKKRISFLVLLILFVPLISSLDISIDISPQFTINEQVSFDYTIISDTNEEIGYIVGVSCPDAHQPLLDLKQTTTPITETYTFLTVDETTEPQNCTAFVSIIEPYEISEEKTFKIITNPSFDFELATCNNKACSDKLKIFIKGETIYLQYTSEISDIEITSTITYPDGTTQDITLPSSIKAEQIGTYELEAQAIGNDYKTVTDKIQFGVIGESVKISGSASEGFLNQEPKFWIIVSTILFTILIVAVILILKVRNQKMNPLKK